MIFLLILLLVGVLAYLGWLRVTTTLTRNCRWRRTGAGEWRCAYCGGSASQQSPPKFCARR